jgi:hypothetical protein
VKGYVKIDICQIQQGSISATVTKHGHAVDIKAKDGQHRVSLHFDGNNGNHTSASQAARLVTWALPEARPVESLVKNALKRRNIH